MAKTIFQMKTDLSQIGAEMTNTSQWLADNAADPSVSSEDIKKKQEHYNDLQMRYDTLNAEIKRFEDMSKPAPTAGGEKNDKLETKANFYRSILAGIKPDKQVMASLGAIGTDKDGANFLPTQLASDIITEPMEKNPLREVCTMTNISGLEIPKINFTLEDDDFVDDSEAAKEIEATGNKVEFGKFKVKVMASIPDTVYHGTNTNLVSIIESALAEGLAKKEKNCIFNASPLEAHKHMSLYASNIKNIEGANLLDAILNCIGDLDDSFAENAVIIMNRAKYTNMIKELTNSATDLWGKKPEDIIGYPVIFCNTATDPIVGDARYLHINYENNTIYDTAKDIKTGDYQFVLTAWFDIHIKLLSAFRIAKVTSGE